jgi:small subunit ribosomal protein S7
MAKKFKKREITPDSNYDSVLISRFINKIMKGGKKSVAQKIIYQAMEIIKKKSNQEPLTVLEQAVENVSPIVEVKPQRVGGATYQVPKEVKGERKESLAIRWIINVAESKSGKKMEERLAEELLNAYNNEGEAVKKKINMHKMAEANRAFAHFAH